MRRNVYENSFGNAIKAGEMNCVVKKCGMLGRCGYGKCRYHFRKCEKYQNVRKIWKWANYGVSRQCAS